MNTMFKTSTLISKVCQIIGGFSLIFIVMVTISDVVTRYLFKVTDGNFGFTVKGSVELVSYFMLFSLLSAFAAFVERSQIIVDVFTQKLNKNLKAYLMAIFLLGFMVAGLIMAWGMYENMHDAIKYSKVTQDLRLPMTPVYALGSLLCLLLAIRSLIESLKILKTGEYYDAEETGA